MGIDTAQSSRLCQGQLLIACVLIRLKKIDQLHYSPGAVIVTATKE